MSGFKDGYETFYRVSGANLGAIGGADYINTINTEIEKLVNAMNNPARKIDNVGIDYVKGFVAEWWHEGAFNIDAAVKGLSTRAVAPNDNGLVDIFLSGGDSYQVKYYKSAQAGAKQQAKTNYERYKEYLDYYRKNHNGQESPVTEADYLNGNFKHDPYYLGQGRLIPSDQLKDAQAWLKRQIAKEAGSDQVKRYQETLDKLTDRLKSSDGAESIPLTEAEAKELARIVKEKGFDPAKFGLTTEELVNFEHIMNQAFKAGLSAAMVSVILKVAPEVCGIILKLIKNEKVHAEDFKRLGFAALQGGAEGFIRGTVAAAVSASCASGLLGTTLKGLGNSLHGPSIIGAVTAIALNAVQNACLMSLGKIDRYDFSYRCAQDLVVVVCSIGGGIVGAAFMPATAVLGYMIGSFVGSVVGGFVFNGVYSCVLSFCVDTGCTFFGLVEQDYTLPENVLEELGMDLFEYEKFQPLHIEPLSFEPLGFEPQRFEPLSIGITVFRRGVIGVNRIGYM